MTQSSLASRRTSLLPRRPRRKALSLPRTAGIVLAPTRVPGRWTSALGGVLGALPRPAPVPHRDPVLALVQRITPGFDLAEYERARALGYEAYLEEQLDPLAIDDSALDARLAGFTTLALSPKALVDAYADDFSEPYLQFKGAALLRAVHSKRRLFERMCEFWNDHFSIDQNKGDVEWALLPENERLVVLPNALGSFPALLSASAHGAAMLYYLDNWLNTRGAPQENYARELMELHTLGLHGGYDEVDVKEVAKCFTGWTLVTDYGSGDFLRATFDASLHVPGPKSVLGVTIPASPPRENAQRVLDLLALHPSTASFLATKLIRWFLTPEPPPSLVARVAAAYLATNGDIRAMLRVILARENLGWASPLVGARFRRPFHFVASLLRTLEADVVDPLVPLEFLYGMGHVPFDHVQPNGYPDTVEAWGSALLPRWGFALGLLAPNAVFGHPFQGVALSFAQVSAKLAFTGPGDRPGLAARIDERLLGRTLAAHELEALQRFIDSYPAPFGGPALYESIALGASLPGFQWY